MALSSDLVSQFVQITQGEKENKENKETTVYGTIVESDGGKYVRLDGSELLTPISLAADAINGERVTVMIKNHTAIVTGNISSPAARTDDVNEIRDTVSSFEIILADKVSVDRLEAEIARIDTLVSDNAVIKGKLEAAEANIDTLTSDNITVNEKLTAAEASIDQLETNKIDASVADITYATIESLDAANAKVNNLEATYGSFHDLTTERLDAAEANIGTLEANKLSVKSADLKYANIDFSNIQMAAVEKLFTKSGIIYDLKVSDGTITGELVGVTIRGDRIQANTLYADKLVVRGNDGNYYKLNTDFSTMPSVEPLKEDMIHGTTIVAKSITAEKVAVDDLVAFGATIGGFSIGNNSIYSGVKESIDSKIAGIYLDSTGQIAFGDDSNYLKFYKTMDEEWKLDISTNFLSYGDKGLELGYKKKGGKWAGYHTQINSNSFNILDANGKVLATYGDGTISFGKNDIQASLLLCGGMLDIRATDWGNYIESTLDSERIMLETREHAAMNTAKKIKENNVLIEYGSTIETFPDYAEIRTSRWDPSVGGGVGQYGKIIVEPRNIDIRCDGMINIGCGPQANSSDHVSISRDTSILGTLSTTRDATIGGNATVKGTLSTTGNATIGGALESGNATVKGTLSTTDNATIGGNLSANYVTGTWLQGTAANAATTKQDRVCVMDSSGWVYTRTLAQILGDIGISCGTWTAKINGGSITKQICTYMKVGNMCSISFYINGKGGTGTEATNFYISGAPFTPNSSATWYGGGCHVQGLYDTAKYPVTGCVIQPNERIYIRTAQVGGTGTGYVRVNNGGATFHLSGSITYPIA